MVLSFEEAAALLDEIADSFPKEFFKELNGAILLLEELKTDPEASDLSIMGLYCRDYTGRHIELYYGSFVRLARIERWSKSDWYDELRHTLAHEFTHHLESLAGERDLEIKDEEFMEEYWIRRAERDGQPMPDDRRPRKFRIKKKTD